MLLNPLMLIISDFEQKLLSESGLGPFSLSHAK